MDWLEKLIDGATQVQIARNNAKSSQQYQQLGERGYYVEGQPGVAQVPQNGMGISTGMLMMAGLAVVALLVLKD